MDLRFGCSIVLVIPSISYRMSTQHVSLFSMELLFRKQKKMMLSHNKQRTSTYVSLVDGSEDGSE